MKYVGTNEMISKWKETWFQYTVLLSTNCRALDCVSIIYLCTLSSCLLKTVLSHK